MTEAFVEVGYLVNSAEFDGVRSDEAIGKIIDYIEQKGYGKRKINYRLRDWLISRQRYWGAPIPIIYCDDCGAVPVPEEDLPVILPTDIKFSGVGESPLSRHSYQPLVLNAVRWEEENWIPWIPLYVLHGIILDIVTHVTTRLLLTRKG